MSQVPKLLVHRAALTNIVRRIVLAAGEITLDHFDAGGMMEVITKDDGSPVTQADRQTEEMIVRELEKTVPGVPIIAEELAADGQCPACEGSEYVWFVDALDGTKEFIAGGEDFTLNIALVKNGEPVLGVVYAPARGELYAGYTEEDGTSRALRWLEETNNEKDLKVRSVPRAGMTVMISKSRSGGEPLDSLLSGFKVEKVVKRASSLKLCAIAAGKADLYPRFGPTCVWDTAAGHAILCAAGGDISLMDGALLRYSGAVAPYINPDFIAWGAPIEEIL